MGHRKQFVRVILLTSIVRQQTADITDKIGNNAPSIHKLDAALGMNVDIDVTVGDKKTRCTLSL